MRDLKVRVDELATRYVDTASYYVIGAVIVASAGHDTTKDAISGGMRPLIDNPAEPGVKHLPILYSLR